MALAPSVQRKIMWLTPTPFLEILCRINPRFVIGLLCHWLNEKNINIEERFLAPRLINPVGVAKKLSQLSVLGILNLLRQDESLWQFYAPTPHGGIIINLTVLPYILLELMFDLGGEEGRKKVADVVAKSRTTIGGAKQLQILKAFKTDTVLDIFEMIPEMEINMIFKNLRSNKDPKTGDDENIEILAFWLNYWDLRMQRIDQPPKSAHWLGKLPGEQAFRVERKMRELEFRKKFDLVPGIFEKEDAWRKAQAPKALK
jgi:hypothetical protein